MADSPYEVVATALKTLIDAEFSAESITAIHDNVHESLGIKRVSVGIAPMREAPLNTNSTANEIWIEVRFYDLWNPKIDPTQAVNPFKITAYAERFRRAVRAAAVSHAGSNEVWYYDLRNIDYGNDPTGNKTRFTATLRAFGDNTGLLETR